MPRWSQEEYRLWEARGFRNILAPSTAEPATDESKLHTEILEYLKSKGVRCVVHSRMDRPSTNQVGVPDLIFVYAGKPYALEAKAKGRKLTPAQVGWLAAMKLDGWTTGVVRSLEDVKTLMGL